MSEKNCPTQDNLREFLVGEMPPSEKETLELHLADCADCRQNLVAVFVAKAEETETFKTPKPLTETIKNLPASKSKANSLSFFSFAWLGKYRLQTAFAAILLVCFGFAGFYFLRNQTTSNSDDVLRNGAANKDLIKLLAPEDSVVVKGSFVEFEWEKVSDASSYILIISDEKGDIIFQEQTKQTKFNFGRAYPSKRVNKQDKSFWYVQAKLIDGKIIESTPRKIFFEY